MIRLKRTNKKDRINGDSAFVSCDPVFLLKAYGGKSNVRFDEGELEIELLATTPALYSTVFVSQEMALLGELAGRAAT
jgi:hypothetical protein